VKNLRIGAAALVILTSAARAQTPDSLRTTDLSEVVVEGTGPTRQLSLPDRHDGFLTAGKKSVVLPVGGAPDNPAMYRQRAALVCEHGYSAANPQPVSYTKSR